MLWGTAAEGMSSRLECAPPHPPRAAGVRLAAAAPESAELLEEASNVWPGQSMPGSGSATSSCSGDQRSGRTGLACTTEDEGNPKRFSLDTNGFARAPSHGAARARACDCADLVDAWPAWETSADGPPKRAPSLARFDEGGGSHETVSKTSGGDMLRTVAAVGAADAAGAALVVATVAATTTTVEASGGLLLERAGPAGAGSATAC